ncbi:MAG: hypothetical protein ACPG7F_15050 [Aggregatilineales bacterium]
MNKTKERREAIYAFVESYIEEHQTPPSLREIARGCGLRSTATVSRYLSFLEAQGRLYRIPDQARGIRLITHSHALEEMTMTIYAYIVRSIKLTNLAPSRQEIAAEHFISTDTVRRHLSILEGSGKIRVDFGKARGIHLIEA